MSGYPFISGILVAFLWSKCTIFSSRSGPDFVHLQEAMIPNWHFWSSVLKRRPHALRFVLQEGVPFGRSHGRFMKRVFLTFLPWLRSAPFRLFHGAVKQKGRRARWESRCVEGLGLPDPGPISHWQPFWTQGSRDKVECNQLALPTLSSFFPCTENSPLGGVHRPPGRVEAPSFGLSRQARMRIASSLYSPPLEPLGGPGDLGRPDLCLQKSVLHTGCPTGSVAILIQLIFYSKPSLSQRGA